jgi:hypothetical protein
MTVKEIEGRCWLACIGLLLFVAQHVFWKLGIYLPGVITEASPNRALRSDRLPARGLWPGIVAGPLESGPILFISEYWLIHKVRVLTNHR